MTPTVVLSKHIQIRHLIKTISVVANQNAYITALLYTESCIFSMILMGYELHYVVRTLSTSGRFEFGSFDINKPCKRLLRVVL